MVVPYPPGIPILMPGENVETSTVEYLEALQAFDRRFPGFPTTCWAWRCDGGERHSGYRVSCLLDDATTVAGGSAAAGRSEP